MKEQPQDVDECLIDKWVVVVAERKGFEFGVSMVVGIFDTEEKADRFNYSIEDFDCIVLPLTQTLPVID